MPTVTASVARADRPLGRRGDSGKVCRGLRLPRDRASRPPHDDGTCTCRWPASTVRRRAFIEGCSIPRGTSSQRRPGQPGPHSMAAWPVGRRAPSLQGQLLLGQSHGPCPGFVVRPVVIVAQFWLLVSGAGRPIGSGRWLSTRPVTWPGVIRMKRSRPSPAQVANPSSVARSI